MEVKEEVHYRSDLGTSKTIFKKGKTFSSINPPTIPDNVLVKPLKLRDVENLLQKHYGENWRTMDEQYYNQLLLIGDGIGLQDENEQVEQLETPNFEEVHDLVV